jgi:hypothetical protein
MVISKCSKCGSAITGPGMGRQAMITIEKFADSGMNVTRRFLCDEHERELLEWFEPVDVELEKMAGACGNE